MHYLPFMAAITLTPWWEEEMKGGGRRRGGGGGEGETQPAEGWWLELWCRGEEGGHLERIGFV